MPRQNIAQVSFNAGAFDPRMVGRVDYNKYAAGAAVAVNLLALPQGGFTRRPGGRFVVEVKTSTASNAPCLFPFQFSIDQAYVLEGGDNYFRFNKSQAQITVADTAALIANGTFASTDASWTDCDTSTGSTSRHSTAYGGSLELQPGGTGSTQMAAREQTVGSTANGILSLKFRVAGIQGDKARLRVGASTSSTGNTSIVNEQEFKVGYHVYSFTASSTATVIGFSCVGSDQNRAVYIDNVELIDNAALEVETPYDDSDLFDLQYTQTADVMYVFHPDYPTHALQRTAHNNWSLVEVMWQDGPYLDANHLSASGTATTIYSTSSTVTGSSVLFTASTALGINEGSTVSTALRGFSTNDVGRVFTIEHGSTLERGWGIITDSTSATTIRVHIKRAFASTAASSQWSLGSWGTTGIVGYPAVGSFFEQRIFGARTYKQPQTFWASQSGDIENQRYDSFSTAGINAIQSDDAFDYTLAADDVNVIQWFSPGTFLAMGCAGGEWIIRSEGAALTPTDVQTRRNTKSGCAGIMPVRADYAVLYAQRGQRQVHEYAFNFDVDSFVSNDLTLLSPHITRGLVKQMAYQKQPDSLLWAITENGRLISMTYRRNQDVVGWTEHKMGGSYQGGPAIVESIAVIPGSNGSGQVENSVERDELWAVVKRTINGSTERYIEVVEKSFEGVYPEDYDNDMEDEGYIDDLLASQRHAYYVDSCITSDPKISIAAISAESTCLVTTVTAHGYSTGNIVLVNEVTGTIEVNGNSYRVGASTSSTTFRLYSMESTAISSTGFTTYTSSGLVRKKSTAFAGAAHLAGATIKILGDGAVLPDSTVNSTGGFQTDTPAAVIQAGLGYKHRFKSLMLQGGAVSGTPLAQVKRPNAVSFLLHNSAAFNVGPKFSTLSPVTFRDTGDAMDTAVPLFTGIKEVKLNNTYGRDPRICAESDNPAPWTMLAIVPQLKTNELI